MLQQDNTKFINSVGDEMKRGKKKFYEALNNLSLWIEREKEPLKSVLKNMYDTNTKDYGNLKDMYDKLLTNQPIVVNSEGQVVKSKPSGGSGKGGKDDDDKESRKMKEALGEAIVTEKPNVKWDDISGLENAKKALQEAVILPIKFPHLFEGARTPWKGILLYGPPGTGKTFLAKACATETDGTFISVSSADLISKYVGESEKMIKTLFQMAREKKPTIIFIDEIDSLCSARSDNENEASRRVKTEFLVQMQGVGNSSDGILVLGATNIPWGLDSAIRRRFEKRIYIPLPEAKARMGLLQNLMKKTPSKLQEADFALLAEKTDGYSGSDMSVLVRDAVYEPVRKCQSAKIFFKTVANGKTYYSPVLEEEVKFYDRTQLVQKTLIEINGDELRVPEVTVNDFLLALNKSKKSVSKDQLKEYEKWTEEFGQEG